MQPDDRIAWAAATLRRTGKPPEEIRAVLTSDDRETVRRHMELHRERLEEQLAEQRKMLDPLERGLVEAMLERRRVA